MGMCVCMGPPMPWWSGSVGMCSSVAQQPCFTMKWSWGGHDHREAGSVCAPAGTGMSILAEVSACFQSQACLQ